MACRKGGKNRKNEYLAKLVTSNRTPCVFCKRDVDDEVIYGKLYAIGDIQCHYFCVLLSCCLVQKGKDEEGLFGFLYNDIVAEVERSKKHKCSYCGREGATLGCSVSQCRKQFHLPCGREKNAVSLFYGNFKTYCQQHAPKQNIPEAIMCKARVRKRDDKKKQRGTELEAVSKSEDVVADMECVICYERVAGYATPQTFWPPCCARDAWFHRICLQNMALSAGMHYLKCPLCNDKENFYQAVISQGYYVPDRDAAWELEQNAFAEIYERAMSCSADDCECPMGRKHDAGSGIWDMTLCILCGSTCAHVHCIDGEANRYVCVVCKPAAPTDLDTLATRIDEVIIEEQAQSATNVRRGPVMPSRMSLRRTKQRMLAQNNISSSSRQTEYNNTRTDTAQKTDVTSSRKELNLVTPKPPIIEPSVLKNIENKLLSPIKMLEKSIQEKITNQEVNVVVDSTKVIEEMREKFRKPKPLSEKKKIINGILESLFDNIPKDNGKTKEPVKVFCSPKKNMNENVIEVPQEIEPPQYETQVKSDDTDKEIKVEAPEIVDDSSNSTFQLPSEFIADHNSDDSLPLFDTPKKLKTVDIKKDSSLEIFEDDEIINIDVQQITDTENKDTDLFKNLDIKSPVKTKTCAFKFSPLDKEKLQKGNIDIDLEGFKNQYLNEVDRDFHCKYSHKHESGENNENKLRTAIDFAIEAAIKKEKDKPKLKRKLGIDKDDAPKRKKKKRNIVLEYDVDNKNDIELTVDKKKKLKKRIRTKVSIRDKNIQVKIKWKKEQLKLNIRDSNSNKRKVMKDKDSMKKKKVKKQKRNNNLKQYVLNFSPEKASGVLVKPLTEVTPLKQKNAKQDKSPDNLVQTSIQSFFKIKPPEN